MSDTSATPAAPGIQVPKRQPEPREQGIRGDAGPARRRETHQQETRGDEPRMQLGTSKRRA